MENIIEQISQYITLDNLAIVSVCYLYFLTVVGYYRGVVVASGALDDFPYPRIARFLCLFWPLFMVASMIGAYFEGEKKV